MYRRRLQSRMWLIDAVFGKATPTRQFAGLVSQIQIRRIRHMPSAMQTVTMRPRGWQWSLDRDQARISWRTCSGGSPVANSGHGDTRTDRSGISNDVLLFSDIGLSLVHHYRVHKRGLPHVAFRRNYMSQLRALLPSLRLCQSRGDRMIQHVRL